MQGAVPEVITIDSDSSDEFESSPPPKRYKASVDTLKEISTFTENQLEVKNKHKNGSGVNSLTIIIESDEIAPPKGEIKQRTSITTSVVVLDEEPPKEIPTEPKENINNDCTVILDDPSEESEDPNEIIEPRNPAIKPETQETENSDIYDRPSTSTASEAHRLLDQFLETCAGSIRGSKYESRLLTKFPKMRKHFNNCNSLHEEPNLKQMLQEQIGSAKFSAPDAVISFQRIYSYLLDNINGTSIEISEENLRKIRKLERTCKLLLKKLKQLEETELDFSDESDSTYMQIDRYSQRLSKVYNKYCQLMKRSPHTGRLLYEKIRFVSSKYDEINRAITKAYKHNKFPTYYDVEKCVRNCTSKNNLPLTEADIKEESRNCFTKLGNLMQLRRKKELYEVHCGFITLSEDPANNDPELKSKLQESLVEGDKKMKEVVEKYVKLQDNNITVNMSEDSDDSHYKSSESDE
ncbi:Daxx domain containing protein [Asbolus verrucosus]|uniref:Daxx domain containing protein n=1 Tax=Asbolus verrucosus TaxID=1661398 RepID=A0A482WBM7_ASBVE|nr:Daxx domain containing protein [Asbolus verrucosus]